MTVAEGILLAVSIVVFIYLGIAMFWTATPRSGARLRSSPSCSA
jgi:hypothetical protein